MFKQRLRRRTRVVAARCDGERQVIARAWPLTACTGTAAVLISGGAANPLSARPRAAAARPARKRTRRRRGDRRRRTARHPARPGAPARTESHTADHATGAARAIPGGAGRDHRRGSSGADRACFGLLRSLNRALPVKPERRGRLTGAIGVSSAPPSNVTFQRDIRPVSPSSR